jgi:fatty-acid desaturase
MLRIRMVRPSFARLNPHKTSQNRTFSASIGTTKRTWPNGASIFVRTTLLYHATYLVNSATHMWGYRSHKT